MGVPRPLTVGGGCGHYGQYELENEDYIYDGA